jgi:hypothetical protein
MKILKNSFLSVVVVLLGTTVTSCNSNDDGVQAGIEIPGITITDDIDCCSAEEALQVYRFLQTVKIVPELSTVIDGKYNVFAYTKTGALHTGYNDIYFVATKQSTGNYIKNFDVTNLTPLMHMVKMDMYHSTPVGGAAESFNGAYLAVKRTWVSLVMNTSDAGSWTLSYDALVLGKTGGIEKKDVVVNALPNGQVWLKSFKAGDDTYYLSLVNPNEWQTGTNGIRAYVSKKSAKATTPYLIAENSFTIGIDPRMPDMGNHTSPNNTALVKQTDGSYQGTINLTMTGLWRIHLTVKDADGNVVAGGEELSSLYWDVTI